MSEMLTPLSDSRHTKAEGKFTPQICRSRIFVPANECTRVVPMYPSQSAMSHLHSLAQSMYIATFLPKHVIPTCFADYVTSTSGAIRLAFDLSPWPQVNKGIATRNRKRLGTRASGVDPLVLGESQHSQPVCEKTPKRCVSYLGAWTWIHRSSSLPWFEATFCSQQCVFSGGCIQLNGGVLDQSRVPQVEVKHLYLENLKCVCVCTV